MQENKLNKMPYRTNEPITPRAKAQRSVGNAIAMVEGSKAMGIARAKQDLAAKAVEANKKRKKNPIGPIVL